MPHPKVKIADNSGNTVDVTSNALDVNIAGGASIDIGDVDMFLDGGTAILGGAGAVAPGVLRVTLASDDAHFGAVGTASDADGVIHGQLRHMADNLADIESDTGFIKTNTSNASTYLGLLVNVTKTFGTSTYTETSSYGNAIAAVRNDDLATLADTDNEFAPLQVNENGALYVTSGADHSGTVVANGTQIMAEAKSIDGSALPNSTAEGDAIRIAATRAGVLYSTLSSLDGQKSPVIDDGDEQVTTPSMINVGGEYRIGDTTYDNGDATILQTNVNGALKVVGTVDLGSTDNAVLDAMVVDLAAMEALLITIDSDTDAIKTAVQILDDWDDSNYANVNINLAGSDAPTGGGAESGALRVTLANDSTGVISIDDGGNTITVDGTVTANLGTTDNAVLDAIAASLALLDNSIASGSELQVDVVAALPAGTNAIGKLAANDGVDIGDVSVNNLGAWLTSTTGAGTSPAHVGTENYVGADTGLGILAVCSDTLSALANVTDGEYTQLQVNTDGALYVKIDGGVDHNITGMVSGKNTGVDDTTAEVIVASAACKRIDMQASPSNTGDIWVGGSNVAVNQGIRLQPGDFYSIDVDNTADIYVLASVDEEDIHFTYYT